MIFLLDVDGVVGQCIPHLYKCLEEKGYGEKLPALEDFTDMSCLGSLAPLANTIMEEPGFASAIPIIDGAVEAVNKIRKAGHTIFWLTAPKENSATWQSDRSRWLEANMGTNLDYIISTRAKFLVRGNVFIDDLEENLFRWSKYNKGTTLCYSQPWNKNSKIQRFEWNMLDDFL